MAFGGGSGGGVKNEINVTPLVDVVLVLLIIFMVVTPMLQRGKDVKLPKSRSTEQENKEGDPLIVSVTADKRVWVEKESVGDNEVEKMVRPEIERDRGRKVLVKGDQDLTVGDIRKVMQQIRLAGARGVSLGVEELKAK